MIDSRSNVKYSLYSEYSKRCWSKRGVDDHYSIVNIWYIFQNSADKVGQVHGGTHSNKVPSVPRSTEIAPPGGRGEHQVQSDLKGKLGKVIYLIEMLYNDSSTFFSGWIIFFTQIQTRTVVKTDLSSYVYRLNVNETW